MNQKIQGKPVFVISKSYCPFCVKGKNVLKKYNIKPEALEIMEIENDPDMNEIQVVQLFVKGSVINSNYMQDYMKQLTGGRSVPRVFIGGKCIGGGDETESAHRSGKLQGMLESAGAL